MTLVEKSYMWATPSRVSIGMTSPPMSVAIGVVADGLTTSISVCVSNT